MKNTVACLKAGISFKRPGQKATRGRVKVSAKLAKGLNQGPLPFA
jgi:hypothetical protein